MAELRIDEDRIYERADARWFRLVCTDPACDVRIGARIAPASSGDSLIAAFQRAHDQLHAATPDTPQEA